MIDFLSGDLKLNKTGISKLAEKYGTPLYVYDFDFIQNQIKKIKLAFTNENLNPDLHYSVKANSNLALLKRLKKSGCRFDVVSGGEINRCLKIGATGDDIVFAGVGKTQTEIDLGISNNIRQFNVESESELELISARARALGKKANVGIRINPNIDAKTHEFITTGTYDSKFGVSLSEAEALYLKYKSDPNIILTGLDMHIGSQLTEIGPIVDSLKKYVAFVLKLKALGVHLKLLDIGGGLGIRYKDEKIISPSQFAKIVKENITSLNLNEHVLAIEPGRFIVGEAGLLITRIEYIKKIQNKIFAITDAGMTELMRPCLYGAYHEIEYLGEVSETTQLENVDIVGPICESTDQFGKGRSMPPLKRGDLLAIRNCGAYSSSMATTYNTRGRAPEIIVEAGSEQLVRRREVIEDLLLLEKGF